jgi:hypothetical protein
MNRPDSTVKNMPKLAEEKLSSCGLQKKIVIAGLRLQSNISFKSCPFSIR